MEVEAEIVVWDKGVGVEVLLLLLSEEWSEKVSGEGRGTAQ